MTLPQYNLNYSLIQNVDLISQGILGGNENGDKGKVYSILRVRVYVHLRLSHMLYAVTI